MYKIDNFATETDKEMLFPLAKLATAGKRTTEHLSKTCSAQLCAQIQPLVRNLLKDF